MNDIPSTLLMVNWTPKLSCRELTAPKLYIRFTEPITCHSSAKLPIQKSGRRYPHSTLKASANQIASWTGSRVSAQRGRFFIGIYSRFFFSGYQFILGIY